MTKDFFQPTFDNLEVRQDASLSDFTAPNHSPIITAVHALLTGQIQELYIVGEAGVGKTHLGMAITHEFSHHHKSVISISLMDVPVTDDVLAGFENFDLVILDDLQEAGKDSDWQEVLFDFINQIRKEGKQLLFLATHHAKELHIELPDLLTRLSLMPTLHLPNGQDIDDQKAILTAILRRKNWRLPDEIFEYLLNFGPSTAKDVVSLLNQITPRLTHLSKTVPKKTIQDIKQIIDKQTLVFEVQKQTQSPLS